MAHTDDPDPKSRIGYGPGRRGGTFEFSRMGLATFRGVRACRRKTNSMIAGTIRGRCGAGPAACGREDHLIALVNLGEGQGG
jgi:hypothetical protein